MAAPRSLRTPRVAVLHALVRAARTATRPGGPGVVELVRGVPRLLGAALSGRYAGLGRGRLVLLAVALAYVVSPVDVVPEGLLLALGLADDVAVAAWAAGLLLVETDRFLAWERTQPERSPAWVPGEVVEPAAG